MLPDNYLPIYTDNYLKYARLNLQVLKISSAKSTRLVIRHKNNNKKNKNHL